MKCDTAFSVFQGLHAMSDARARARACARTLTHTNNKNKSLKGGKPLRPMVPQKKNYLDLSIRQLSNQKCSENSNQQCDHGNEAQKTTLKPGMAEVQLPGARASCSQLKFS